MKRANEQRKTTVAILLLGVVLVSGCGRATYPEEKIVSAIREICRKEYSVANVQAKFNGKTLGVYLPLKKLFAGNVKQAFLAGNLADPQALFASDAMEKLEDVFFATSRVFLSSDKDIDFYTLQATDVKTTGFQLVLSGYVPDVRRLRLWDISRGEYRKRVLHELKYNRAVVWNKVVRDLFADAQIKNTQELAERYFTVDIDPETVSPLFYHFFATLDKKQDLDLQIKEIKSRSYRENQALVYVQVAETYEPKPGVPGTLFLYPSGETLEYIFLLQLVEDEYQVSHVFSLDEIDASGALKEAGFPEELARYQDLDTWFDEFIVEDVKLGEFLARQLNRRAQELLIEDERVRHTLKHAQFNFTYQDQSKIKEEEGEPHFALHFDFRSKTMKRVPQSVEQVIQDEDIRYVLNLVLRDFVELIRSYRFEDYTHFQLIWDASRIDVALMLPLDQLELFRKKKLDIGGLLETPLHSGPHSLI